MNQKIITLICSVCFLLSCEQEKAPSQTSLNLIYRDCGVHYNEHYDIQCYYYQSEKSDGFRLPVAHLRRKNGVADKAQRSLLVYMPGGPGLGLRTRPSEIQYWIDLAKERQIKRDILLFDPRGTGDGNLSWDCPEYRKRELEALAEWGFSEAYAQATDEMIRECLKEYDQRIRSVQRALSKTDTASGLGAFSTRKQAFDSIEIAKALGYKSVHLWAASYGTRTALMAAQSPIVKTLVLDSPFPFHRGSVSDMLALYDESFETHQKLYQVFMRSPSADFDALYKTISKRIQDGNISTNVSLDSGSQVPLILTPHRLMQMTFSVLYRAGENEVFYEGLNVLAEEERITDGMQILLQDYAVGSSDQAFNHLVYHATRCNDDMREEQDVLAKALERYPRVAWYFSSTGKELCDDPLFSQVQTLEGVPYTDKPTLIFSGQFDPVTPVSMAKELTERLPRSKLVTIKGASHALLFHIDCDWQFLSHFFATTDVSIPVQCEAL